METSTSTCGLELIHYYCQEGLFHHAENVANNEIKKNGCEPVFVFFRAFALLMQGSIKEAIRDLENIKNDKDLKLCCIIALIYAQKKSSAPDVSAVQKLEVMLKEERKLAGELPLYYAAVFLWHIGHHDNAREYVDRMIKVSCRSRKGIVLKGWIDLTAGTEALYKRALKYLDESLQDEKDVFALMGRAKYFEVKQNFSGALEIMNRIIVGFPTFLPAMVEKMKLQLALQDWEEALGTAQRILEKDSNCLEALKMWILFMLCHEGNFEEAAKRIHNLKNVLEQLEPSNAKLCCYLAVCFSRVCGRNLQILEQTFALTEKAFRIDCNNAEIATELGNQLLLQDKIQGAREWYQKAFKMDGTSLPASIGILKCQLLEGNLLEAEQQLEILHAIQESIGKSAELKYLQALLATKRRGQENMAALLDDAIDIHLSSLHRIPLGFQYFEMLNADFLLEMAKIYITLLPAQPGVWKHASPFSTKCLSILDLVINSVPILKEGLLLMAKVKYIAGDLAAAQVRLNQCLQKFPAYSDAHLLLAQIHLFTGCLDESIKAQEMALSCNFQIREHPLYHWIKAQSQKRAGQLEEAKITLQEAVALLAVNRKAKAQKAIRKKVDISNAERAAIFLELVDTHRLIGEQHEAANIMQDALNECSGTPEEVIATVCNADLAISIGDVNGALSMLKGISFNQPYFLQAKEKMAQIYLEQRKDKSLYLACYKELQEKLPDRLTLVLLGDAYMTVHEPEKAAEVYEQVIINDEDDAELASKIGRALVQTHNYEKALSYYAVAVKSKRQSNLQLDLSQLLLKLKQYEEAAKVLEEALDHPPGNDLNMLMLDVKYLMLLAEVYSKSSDSMKAAQHLIKARVVQAQVLKRVLLEQPHLVVAQKQLSAQICSQLAEHAKEQHDLENALKFYKEVQAYCSSHMVLLQLAEVYLEQGDLDNCQQMCITVLNEDKNSDAATMMLADLCFKKQEYEEAIVHFQNILEKKPDNFTALARLMDLLRRAGKLEDAPKLLDLSANVTNQKESDAGYNYCRGLFLWFSGEPAKALSHFNNARKDYDWGQVALRNMIEIYLNPDDDVIGGQVFDNMDGNRDSERCESLLLAVCTAEKLVLEVRPKTELDHIRLSILRNKCLMGTRRKNSVEKALEAFTKIATDQNEYVPALLGMATASMILKQTSRARNFLKRLTSMPWDPAVGDDFEKSWLLLSDIYIQAGKYHLATDLLNRCVKHNKACCKGYEYMGFIFEKELIYKDAVASYEMAWKYAWQSNPTIGYKLAFNYRKTKRYVDAIDVCHKVLSVHPNYPKIREEILDKARASIRI
uniref:tetratricopeptide repeat protein 21B n=1 Tax=Myxine glutinosa TaxID=7769 RepID=UPI00358DF2F5